MSKYNGLIVFGIFGTVFMTLPIILAPWITSDPTEQHVWIGAQPPGSTYPDCLSELQFFLGEKADGPSWIANTKQLEIITEEKVVDTIRISIRRGKIRRITQDAKSLKEIDLYAVKGRVLERLEDGTSKAVSRCVVKAGHPVPSGFVEPGKRVVFLELISKTQPKRYSISLIDGVIQSIYQYPEKIKKENIFLRGETIQAIIADGKEREKVFLLGTDELGRDLFSRIAYGGRISLLIGIVATFVSTIIGIGYGSISAYIGGKTDVLLMGIVDILYAVPFMFLVIILLALFDRNIVILFVALGAVQWLTMARIVRGQILSLKEMEFVMAAKICGTKPLVIILRHLIPNAIGPILVYATLTIPVVILEESFLSFIGLTVQYKGENLDSWGALIFQGVQALGIDGTRSWLLIFPSIAMITTLFSLNALGDGLRDHFDPQNATCS